ncbi:polysulfide reductase NrfD family protein [Aporhodopirellula aestuarii]|uniref:hypothetical protein n=1 Tax=Aporhodopirellula aestuarii TaxID=2950107 RepID=UPI002033D73C|nr:hypothetical protein [Aporhodopirellula aestuarii]
MTHAQIESSSSEDVVVDSGANSGTGEAAGAGEQNGSNESMTAPPEDKPSEDTESEDAESKDMESESERTEPDSDPVEEDPSFPVESVTKRARPDHPLAASEWRRRKPRWIALYGSQLADMIPETFRPISIEDLATALRDAPQSSLKISEVPVNRLVMIAEVNGNELVSRASRLELPDANDSEHVGHFDVDETADSSLSLLRYRLGPVNVSLIDPAARKRNPAADSSLLADNVVEAAVPLRPRIVSDLSGECFAIGPLGGVVDFEWSARCQHVARGRRWALRLPNATVAQFYLRVAADERLTAEGGAIVELDHPPTIAEMELKDERFEQILADADGSRASGEMRVDKWYLIEPTPGETLSLLLQPIGDVSSRDELMAASSHFGESNDPPVMTVVRGCRIQSRWMGDQLRWTCRLTIDANESIELSELGWEDAEITAVRRDNVDLPFEWTGKRVRWTNIPVGESDARSGRVLIGGTASTSLVFEGVSKQRGKQVRLPRPLFPAQRFFVPPQTWQLQLEIPSWSVFNEARLPDGWNVRSLPSDFSLGGDRLGLSTLEGDQETAATETTATWLASGPPPAAGDPWSVSISENDALVFANHQVRFEMDETSIQARGKITVEMPYGSVKPIHLELQDGFQFEFVGVGEARRSVPTGPPAGRGRQLMIWPGGNEVVDNRVSIYVTARARRNSLARRASDNSAEEGQPAPSQTEEQVVQPGRDVLVGTDQAKEAKPLDANTAASQSKPKDPAPPRARGVVPPSNRGAAIAGQSIQYVGALWLIRAADCPGQLLATIIPPSNLSWSAKAAIEPSRKAFSDLSAEQRRFFAPLPGDAIVFGGAIQATPVVSLEKPDVNLSVSLRTLLRGGHSTPTAKVTSGENSILGSSTRPRPIDHVWQTLEVKTEGTAGEIRSMRLRFAADPNASDGSSKSTSKSMPPWSAMQWSVQLQSNQPEFALDDDAITRQYIEGAHSWEVRITLPPRFSNQSLLIGRRRESIRQDGSKLTIGLPNVPDAASQSAEVWIDASLQLKQHFETLKGVPTLESSNTSRSQLPVHAQTRWSLPGASSFGTARYRYEPNDRPWIEVMPRWHHSPTGLIVGQRITAVASVSGTDILKLSCLVRSDSEMELTYPLSLHLVEVRRDGELITPRVLPGRGIVLPAPTPIATSDAPRGISALDAAAMKKAVWTSAGSAPRWTRLEVSWISPTTRGDWFRWFQFPDIQIDQLVVDARRELFAATGTSVFQFPAAFLGTSGVSMPLLLPAGFLGSIGWVAAFFLIGLARLVGYRGLPAIGAGIVLAVSAALLWPSAALPLVAFVAVPLTLGALQLTTSVWLRDREEPAPGSSRGSLSNVKSAAISRSADRASYRPDSSRSEMSRPRDFKAGDSHPSQTGSRQSAPAAKQPLNPLSAPPSSSDSWTRRFDAGEIISSEVHAEEIVSGDDSSSIKSERKDDDSEGDFSSSSIVPLLIAFVLTFASSVGDGRVVLAQAPPDGISAPVNQALSLKDKSLPAIDVLVPLKSDGKMLGNKIYIPEAFYNELFFSDVRSRIQSPMIQSVSYELALRSPLRASDPAGVEAAALSGFPRIGTHLTEEDGLFESGSTLDRRGESDAVINRATLTGDRLRQSGAAKLTAKIGLVLPSESRRLRLPYRFEQVAGVSRVQDGVERQSLRWGDDGDGWVWVELPASERDRDEVQSSEIHLTLHCQFEWEEPWVLVSAVLPPLAVADLRIMASEVVDSVMLQNPNSSWQLDLYPVEASRATIGEAASIASEYSQSTDVIHLGPRDKLNLRYQFQDASSTSGRQTTDSKLPWDEEDYWQKRFWVHSQSGKTVIECEIQPRSPLPPEAIVAITTTVPEVHGVKTPDDRDVGIEYRNNQSDDSDTAPTKEESQAESGRGSGETPRNANATVILDDLESRRCQLLTQHWTKQEVSGAEDASEQTLRLMSLATPTRSIRLGWTLTTPKDGEWQIRMPRVEIGTGRIASVGRLDVPSLATQDSPTSGVDSVRRPVRRSLDESLPWVAWTFSDDLQPDWSQIGELEPLAVDQFYAKWTGYLSSINRAAVGTVTDLRLRRIPKPKTPLVTRHEITIDNESQRVEFFAEMNKPTVGTPAAAATIGATRYAVQLPAGARLLDWNFEPISDDPVSSFTAGGQTGGAGDLSGVSETDDNPRLDLGPNAIADTPANGGAPTRQPWTVLKQGELTTLLLTSEEVGFRVKVTAVLPLAAAGKVNRLPLFRLTKIVNSGDAASTDDGGTNDFDQSHELLITRSIDALVKWTKPIGGQRIDAGVEDGASLLAAGKVLIDRFTATGPILEAFDAARFRVRRNSKPFDVDSRITLRWEEGRWTAQTDCVITSDYCPDYLDIALPTRWCDSLQIVPLCISSRQPTLDPALQVLRLELVREVPSATEPAVSTDGGPVSVGDESKWEHVRRFRLISRLAVSEITRVSVPEIRIMDVRRHRIDVVVPTRLTNEQVRWRSNFAGPIEKPRWRIDTSVDSDLAGPTALPPSLASSTQENPEPNSELSVYAVTSPGWSIDLETLPRTDRIARLIHADHRVLVRPQEEQWLLVSRFDVVPGDQSSVRLSIPSSAELIGVWAATRAADLQRLPELPRTQPTDSSTKSIDPKEPSEVIWDVPLPLSRLSQTVEVLIAFPGESRGVLLPTLVDLAQDETPASVDWCELPVQTSAPERSADRYREVMTELKRYLMVLGDKADSASPIRSQTRVRWLASCVVEAISSSSDALADRRDEEVAVWLRPWILRYRMLCDAAGRRIGAPVIEDQPDGLSDAESEIAERLLSWEEMDAFILAQETRYFSVDTFGDERLLDATASQDSLRRSQSLVQRSGVFNAKVASATWSDFLAVSTPPGFVDRWTFAWKGRLLPVRLLAKQRVPLSEYARQQVIRGGLFLSLACLILVVVMFPRNRTSPSDADLSPPTKMPGVNWGHPSLWLFVLSAIGLVLMPIPMALGLMVAAVVLSGSELPRKWIQSHWKRSSKGMK